MNVYTLYTYILVQGFCQSKLSTAYHAISSVAAAYELTINYYYYCSLYSPGTDRTGNASSVIVCSLVAKEIACSQNCSLATAVVLSPVYTAEWVYMSQYSRPNTIYITGGN
jgi:hypothetical protein